MRRRAVENIVKRMRKKACRNYSERENREKLRITVSEQRCAGSKIGWGYQEVSLVHGETVCEET